MLGFYRQFFYKLYCSNINSWKDGGPAASQALAMIFMYLCMNIYAVLVVGDFVFGTKFSSRIFQVDQLQYIGVLTVILIIIWSAFIFNGRYKRIIEDFERAKSTTRQIQNYWFRAYEIGSVAFFICAFIAHPLPAR